MEQQSRLTWRECKCNYCGKDMGFIQIHKGTVTLSMCDECFGD